MNKLYTIVLSSFLLILSNSVKAQIPTDHLVAYYPFANNANDASGNNFHGTVNGATLTADRFGNANSAYSFDGTNDYISIAHNSALNLPNTFSFSIWYKTSSTTKAQRIIDKATAATSNSWMIDLRPDNSVRIIAANSVNQPHSNTGFSTLNQWVHLVVQYDGSKVSFYKNGALDKSVNITGNTPVNTNNVLIGANSLFNGDWFWGSMDDIRIYDRVLTENEIIALYRENQDCFNTVTVTDTLIIQTNVTGYSPLTYENTIKVYPNPARDFLNIDNGDLSKLAGYSIRIENSTGTTVFSSAIDQQIMSIPLNTWTGNGMYFLYIINSDNNLEDVRKIVLE